MILKARPEGLEPPTTGLEGCATEITQRFDVARFVPRGTLFILAAFALVGCHSGRPFCEDTKANPQLAGTVYDSQMGKCDER